MEYIVYVLKNKEGKFYKGVTGNLKRRVAEHRRHNTKTTSVMGELTIAYTEKFDNFEGARKRELYLKSAAGRRFLKKQIGPVA